MPGGRRPGAGRPKGARSKRTLQREERVAAIAREAAAALGADLFDGDAHALLVLTYRNTTLPMDTRLDAAKAAIAYEKPRLSTVDNKLSGNVGYTAIPVAERDPIPAVDAAAWASDGGDPSSSRH